MHSLHFALWDRCRAFVGRVCSDRDASHGLAHMEKVTEQAILLFSMQETQHENETDNPSAADFVATQRQANYDLYRLILIGMLHDVADHKYDHDGTLEQRVDVFIAEEATRLVELAMREQEAYTQHGQSWLSPSLFLSSTDAASIAAQGSAGVAAQLALSLKAISYSAEKKRGMRWFAAELPADWCHVRDLVSDSDKLEAIGAFGLHRCYEFTLHRMKAAFERPSSAPGSDTRVKGCGAATETVALKDVSDHFDEKLSQLLPVFIVTAPGKYLGQGRHAEMVQLLEEWKQLGPPPATVYWRDAPVELA